MEIAVNGPIGLLILVANIYAIVKTVQSSADTLAKVLWIVAIILLPVLGFLLWLVFGPRG
ncbi:MAG: PLDc N-terminal domain-containing protein [Parvibaculaceae bacterium]|nr:PLDc N-terminal domain-containing protein [Kangiella sp.]